MYVNNGAGKPNYTQRNNSESPDSTCNVTAAITALVSAGYTIDETKDQPEDILFRFIRDDIACNLEWDRLDPQHSVRIHQWHSVLALGVNRWMGKDVAAFRGHVYPDDIIAHLMQGGTGYTSGMFPTTRGHFVAFVGFKGETRSGKVVPIEWIIKDPWGNYRTRYANKLGNDICMPHDDFIRIIKPVQIESKYFTFIEPRR